MGFADNLGLLVEARKGEDLMKTPTANFVIKCICKWMSTMCLEKTAGRRRCIPARFLVTGEQIQPEKKINYLSEVSALDSTLKGRPIGLQK